MASTFRCRRGHVVKPLLLAMAASGMISGNVQAATVTVTHFGDPSSASTCSLRQAVQLLNNGGVPSVVFPDTGNCSNSVATAYGTSDTVNFQTGITGSFDLQFGQISIGVPMTIDGPGAAVLQVRGNGGTGGLFAPSGPSRVFYIADGLDNSGPGATIRGLTMSFGNGKATSDPAMAPGPGGCILADSRLDLVESVVSDCTALDRGGGVYVTGNAALPTFPVGDLNLIQSTVTRNTVTCGTADYCGGGGASALVPVAKYSVISDNTVVADQGPYPDDLMQSGGGLDSFASLLLNSTITGNRLEGDTFMYSGAGLVRFGAGAAAKYSYVINSTLDSNTIAANPNTDDSDEFFAGGGLGVSGFALMLQSTVSGNSVPAGAHGAGVAIANADINFKYSVISNSTIANNSGASGLAFTGFAGAGMPSPGPSDDPHFLNSTIVANTIGGVDVYCELLAACPIDGADNLVESFANAGFVNAPLTSDPQLGPLAANGGFTTGAPDATGTGVIRTHAITTTSPAYNTGNNLGLGLDEDQRGSLGDAVIAFPRVQGGRTDIGAYEVYVPVQIPTLQPWGVVLLSSLLALFGWRRRPRHRIGL